MTIKSPFMPSRGANKVVSPAATSANTPLDTGSKSVRLVNSGANICYVRIGQDAQTATTADTPVLSNSALVLQKQMDDNNIGYISASGTTLNIQTGEGGYV
jgi:hypothetical protein